MGILQKDTDLVWTHKLILRSDDPREAVLTYKKQTDRKQANDESLDGSAQASKGEAWGPFHCSSYVSQNFKRQHQNNTEKYCVWQWHQYLPMTFFPCSSQKVSKEQTTAKTNKISKLERQCSNTICKTTTPKNNDFPLYRLTN